MIKTSFVAASVTDAAFDTISDYERHGALRNFSALQLVLMSNVGMLCILCAAAEIASWRVGCRDSYNLHPFVKNGILTVALNGTLRSTDVVNVTVTVRVPCRDLQLLVEQHCKFAGRHFSKKSGL